MRLDTQDNSGADSWLLTFGDLLGLLLAFFVMMLALGDTKTQGLQDTIRAMQSSVSKHAAVEYIPNTKILMTRWSYLTALVRNQIDKGNAPWKLKELGEDELALDLRNPQVLGQTELMEMMTVIDRFGQPVTATISHGLGKFDEARRIATFLHRTYVENGYSGDWTFELISQDRRTAPLRLQILIEPNTITLPVPEGEV